MSTTSLSDPDEMYRVKLNGMSIFWVPWHLKWRMFHSSVSQARIVRSICASATQPRAPRMWHLNFRFFQFRLTLRHEIVIGILPIRNIKCLPQCVYAVCLWILLFCVYYCFRGFPWSRSLQFCVLFLFYIVYEFLLQRMSSRPRRSCARGDTSVLSPSTIFLWSDTRLRQVCESFIEKLALLLGFSTLFVAPCIFLAYFVFSHCWFSILLASVKVKCSHYSKPSYVRSTSIFIVSRRGYSRFSLKSDIPSVVDPDQNCNLVASKS